MTRRDGQLELVDVAGVDVAAWNPRRRTRRWGGRSLLARPLDNFGDLLGPIVVRELVAQLGLRPPAARDGARRRLLAVGSILHFARPGDVVWGSGLNAKAPEVADGLDVRGVRGPRTGERVPGVPVTGDPALLLGGLRPELVVPRARRSGVVVIPNLNELAELRDRTGVVNPRAPLAAVVRRIASGELVVGSSLHGIVVAEALGVPARAVRSIAEPAFKYDDHYLATGRDPSDAVAASVAEAVERGGAPAPVWNPEALLTTFPAELWGGEADAGRLASIARRTRDAVEPGRRLGVPGTTPERG